MSYQLFEQSIDLARGMHVFTLRDEHGNQHIAQIHIGHDACPTCGHAHPKDGIDSLDPKAMVQEVLNSLNASHSQMKAYAAKHGLTIR